MHGHLNVDTTAELLVRQDRLDDARRLRALLRKRAKARPDVYYTRTTITVSIFAVLDWLAVMVHTTLERGAPLKAWLGTHQILVATLSITSCCLGIGWAVSKAACRREAERDEMEQIRHRELLVAVSESATTTEQRAWLSYTTGLRDATGQPRPRLGQDGAVTHLRDQRRPSR